MRWLPGAAIAAAAASALYVASPAAFAQPAPATPAGPLRRAPPITCFTTSQAIEGMTPDACAAEVKAQQAGLRERGLAAEAPLVVVGARGEVLRGATSVTLKGAHGLATATDGTLTCRGVYDGDAPWQTTDILFKCSDGRTGVAKRTASFLNQGEGTLRISDGEVARFAFGCATRVGEVRTCPIVQAASNVSPPPALR